MHKTKKMWTFDFGFYLFFCQSGQQTQNKIKIDPNSEKYTRDMHWIQSVNEIDRFDVVTCKSKLCIDPPGEWRAPFEPNFECWDNWPLAERSLAFARVGIRFSTSSSPSELSILGGCSLSCGGSGILFGNIGVSSVFSIDWNCDECCLLASVTLAEKKNN